MSNEYELARDNRQDLIFTKEQLMAPLLPGMEQPPHPMRLGDDEKDYYVQGADDWRGARSEPGSDVSDAVRGAGPMSELIARPGREPARRCAETGVGEAVAFWILGPVALAGAIGHGVRSQRRPLGAVAGRARCSRWAAST